MSFSQRMGFKSVVKEMQLHSMDIDLQNGLWNVLSSCILDDIKTEWDSQNAIYPAKEFSTDLWHNYFKKRVDEIPYEFYKVKFEIKLSFFAAVWNEVYDIIEFICNSVSNRIYRINIEEVYVLFNIVLEREFSSYRFIQGKIAPITNASEIGEIDDAVSKSGSFSSLKGCNIHLNSALDKLSDRKSPDYRNSIKESISAIESLAKIISDNAKDSLGASLDKIKGKIKIHPALERGFKQIYGYTSDDDGIRHALSEESTCDFEDAKFMLVSSSAFINYLIVKAEKAGVKF